MKFRIVLEFDAETESYSAVCPELPGCASAGVTEEEARENTEEAIRLYLSPSDVSLPVIADEVTPEARLQAVERIRELSKKIRLERGSLTLRRYAHLAHRY